MLSQMLRPPVVLAFVFGLLATVAACPQGELVLQSGIGSNQVQIPVLLGSSQQRVRLRATLDRSGLTADLPTTPSVYATIASEFDDEARAVPARVRAGLGTEDEIDDVDIALLTFISPDESHTLFAEGEEVDLLLVREDDGNGIVALDVILNGEVSGAGDITFGGSPVLSVVPVLEDDEAGEGEGEG